ncbi:putative protease [Escherichia coli]|nr:putative protease [Escherichia coli]
MSDIAPEQYQKLRQDFLNSLTVEMLNQDLRQQLSNDMALILLQPKGEPEFNMKALQAVWDQIMAHLPPLRPPLSPRMTYILK